VEPDGNLAEPDDRDRSATVSSSSGVELLFETPAHDPVAWTLGAFVLSESATKQLPLSEYVLNVLETQLRFSYDSSSRLLSISAPTSKVLCHPYAENWIAEPLRILFGQLIFPRLVARNKGNGAAVIWLRRSPDYVNGVQFASLWDARVTGQDKAAFWHLYATLLTLIAETRGPDGPNFQAHKITRLYEELVQAGRGSRWVWALTLASCVEALAKMLISPGEKRRDADHDAIASLCAHVCDWEGVADVKGRAISAVRRVGDITPIFVLRQLRDRGVVTKGQVSAWSAMRNAVMHGELISPWSTQEEDRRLSDLSQLVHRLTYEILTGSPAPEPVRDVTP
jgi:hypothetical protein